MAPINRYRTQAVGGDEPGGSASALAPGVTDYSQSPYPKASQRCYDVIGFPDQSNEFLLRTQGYIVGKGSGIVSSYFSCRNWYNADIFFDWDLIDPGGVPSNGDLATTLVARTNPSKPEINLPVFVYELRDIPKMIRHVGNRIKKVQKLMSEGYTLRLAAEDSLALQFGWAPLIGDLFKIVDVMFSVDQKVAELNRLYSERGLKRRMVLYRGAASNPSRDYYVGPLYGNQTSVRVHYETRLVKWGTVHYRPITVPNYRGHDEQIRAARQICAGLALRPASLWEAMPWSWMIDWFSNVGDYLSAHDNSVPLSIEDLNIMEHWSIVPTSFEWTSNPWKANFRLNKGYPMLDFKMRTPTTLPVLPTLHLPFLSGKQLSVLSALAIQRYGK